MPPFLFLPLQLFLFLICLLFCRKKKIYSTRSNSPSAAAVRAPQSRRHSTTQSAWEEAQPRNTGQVAAKVSTASSGSRRRTDSCPERVGGSLGPERAAGGVEREHGLGREEAEDGQQLFVAQLRDGRGQQQEW